MLHFHDVSRSFGKRLAVQNLNLSLHRGELLALLGHNGAGKTTTIKMIVGLLKPSAGSISLDNLDVIANAREASRRIGYVPDQPFLYDKLSGREFLQFVADMYGLSADAAKSAIDRECERFQLADFLDDLTETYSHGMRQRTVFAAAMIHQPQLLVVDEPMVGLDPNSIKLVKDLLRRYVAAGNAVLMSTHTLSIAEEIAQRVVVMREGSLVFQGEIDELRAQWSDQSGSLESLYLALMTADENGAPRKPSASTEGSASKTFPQ